RGVSHSQEAGVADIGVDRAGTGQDAGLDINIALGVQLPPAEQRDARYLRIVAASDENAERADGHGTGVGESGGRDDVAPVLDGEVSCRGVGTEIRECA